MGAWAGWVAEVEALLLRVQSEIDELCFELYGISDEDRRAIIEGFSVSDESEDDSAVMTRYGVRTMLRSHLLSWTRWGWRRGWCRGRWVLLSDGSMSDW